jgi:hypothetical protein
MSFLSTPYEGAAIVAAAYLGRLGAETDRGALGTFCRWYVDQWIAASN